METSETKNGVQPIISAADRAFGVPRVGIGVVVLNSQNQVLVGKRKSPHGEGKPLFECTDARNVVAAGGIAHGMLV